MHKFLLRGNFLPVPPLQPPPRAPKKIVLTQKLNKIETNGFQ